MSSLQRSNVEAFGQLLLHAQADFERIRQTMEPLHQVLDSSGNSTTSSSGSSSSSGGGGGSDSRQNDVYNSLKRVLMTTEENLRANAAKMLQSVESKHQSTLPDIQIQQEQRGDEDGSSGASGGSGRQLIPADNSGGGNLPSLTQHHHRRGGGNDRHKHDYDDDDDYDDDFQSGGGGVVPLPQDRTAAIARHDGRKRRNYHAVTAGDRIRQQVLGKLERVVVVVVVVVIHIYILFTHTFYLSLFLLPLIIIIITNSAHHRPARVAARACPAVSQVRPPDQAPASAQRQFEFEFEFEWRQPDASDREVRPAAQRAAPDAPAHTRPHKLGREW
jgi:hypothetical protein